MSVVFKISGERANYSSGECPACADGEWQTCKACGGTGFSDAYRAGMREEPNYVDIANQNARELLEWLGYETDHEDALHGVLTPADLAARCRRRLEVTPENVASDLPRASYDTTGPYGCRVHMSGRSMGYLRARAAELLHLAKRAGDRLIEYS